MTPASQEPSKTPLLEMSAISKSFPGVKALDHVDLTLQEGEVLAVVGENGAGKSTLLKMLGGIHQADDGWIRFRGRGVQFRSPADSMRAGVGIIHQELNLAPNLTAAENLFLGQTQGAWFIRRANEQRLAARLFERIGVEIPTNIPCQFLSIAQQQIIEIAKAISQDVSLLVMDEPTAAITPQEVGRLFQVIADLKQAGIGIIYVSHRLEEITEIADRVVVLRDGKSVDAGPIEAMTRQRMIESMVGRAIENEFPARQTTVGEPRLVVTGLNCGPLVKDVAFQIHKGEVLGLTGLIGSGRTETARAIFGADRPDSGVVELDGIPLRVKSPRDAIRAGLCLLTEDRKSQGLHVDFSVRENFGLPNLSRMSRLSVVLRDRERKRLDHYKKSIRIRITSGEQLVRTLSGGNQQKVVLAKWLERNAEVIIFDEPTRGIDVGAKLEIYLLINELAEQGKSILLISSELPEVLGMSDRILVMHEGRITGTIDDVSNATPEQIMELAVG